MHTNTDNNEGRISEDREVDLELQDVEGIGPTTAKKLKEADINSVMELAVTSAEQLAVGINYAKGSAAAFIMAAQTLLRESNVLEKEFVTASSLLEKRKSMLRRSTGSKSLDESLLDGIETQAVRNFMENLALEKLGLRATVTSRKLIARITMMSNHVIYRQSKL